MAHSGGDIVYRGKNKRGEDTYLVRVVVETDSRGKRKYVCKTVHGGIREAEKVQRDMATKRDQGKLTVRAKDSLNEYLDRWLKTHQTSVKLRTYLNDMEMLDRYIRPHLGETKLGKLTPLLVQESYSTLIQNGLSAATVRRAHSVLRNALKWAVKWQMIANNPAEDVVLPKVEKSEIRPLDPEEAVRFLDACGLDRYGTLFRFLLFTACRPGEALALHWRDINFDKRQVFIRRTYSEKGGHKIVSSPKTKKGTRSIPILDDDLLSELRSMKTAANEKCLSEGVPFDDDALVFTSTTGTPIQVRNLILRHFKPLLEYAGIPTSVRLYDLRHSTATLLLALDVHPKIVQEMLGHSDIQLTMNTYTHVLPNLQKGAAQKLSDLLSKRS